MMIKRLFTLLTIAYLALLLGHASAQSTDDTLRGVIDLHCHSGPDALPRSVSDLELVRLAKRAGLRGLVLKNHFTMTADRAALAMQEVPGIEVFGGIVLNRAVGGLNAEAVRQMVQFEGKRGKVVWLPTFDAENEVKSAKENRPFVSVVKDGRPVPELAEIFRIIAENDLILATGHSSPAESLLLIEEAKKVNVRGIVVTHVLMQGATEPQMKSMAELGAKLECAFLNHFERGQGLKVSDLAGKIQRIGARHFVLVSDLGQYLNPLHADGMKAFILGMREAGMSQSDIDLMTRHNPAWLLGLRD